MNILFTGSYESDYNRNKIIISGLKKLNHTVTELSFKKKSHVDTKILSEKINQSDFVYLPAFTHREVAFVKKLTHKARKKLIFDPLVSRYLTKVHDYKLVSSFGISGWRNFYRDKWSMEAADFVVTDTAAHLEYYFNTFGIPREKMAPLYIGNNFDEYFPMAAKTSNTLGTTTFPTDKKVFKVGFYGGFIPLQGVSNILEAAKILHDHKDIVFEMIGSGFEFEKAKNFVRDNTLSQVNLPGWANQNDLPEQICKFDLALGIFGDTEKSDLVIPNKIYHYAACAKPILTKRSNAISEVFTHDQNIKMIGTSPIEIADMILKLKTDSDARANLGQAAYKKIKEDLNETKVAEQLVKYFEQLQSL